MAIQEMWNQLPFAVLKLATQEQNQKLEAVRPWRISRAKEWAIDCGNRPNDACRRPFSRRRGSANKHGRTPQEFPVFTVWTRIWKNSSPSVAALATPVHDGCEHCSANPVRSPQAMQLLRECGGIFTPTPDPQHPGHLLLLLFGFI